jgi:type II secretory pathway predicted ATPase ExeA
VSLRIPAELLSLLRDARVGTLSRPVLIIDEGQEMQLSVLSELRLLWSARADSHLLLTVVHAGDERLIERFRAEELPPLARISHTRRMHRASN